MIRQGDIYWVDLEEPSGSEPGYRHPHVVLQNNVFNQSRIRTVIVCPLTTNLKRADAPGNVLLDEGEGGLAGVHCGQVAVGRARGHPLAEPRAGDFGRPPAGA